VFIMIVSGLILYLVYGVGSRDLSERLEIRKKRRKFFQRLTGKKETSETA
jgi:iron(III) transport system permease protein